MEFSFIIGLEYNILREISVKNFIQSDKSAVGWLSISHMTLDIYGGFLNPIMPFIAANLGFTMALATVLVAITQICSNMLQPVFGFFADNTPKRFFVFWGLILASTFIPLAPAMPNVPLLTLCMICGCLGGSFFHPQSIGYINTFSPKDCTSNMGFYVGMGSFGFALGPLLAAFITQYIGLSKISYTSILGLALASCMFIFVPKLSDTVRNVRHKEFIKSFKEILNNRQMDCLILVAMTKSVVTNSCCILLPFLWKSMEYSAFYIGFALFLFVFAGSLGSFISPKLEKIFGSKFVIYLSMCGTFPLMILFGLTYKTMPVVSMVIFSIIGFATMLAQPVILVWAQKVLPEYKSITAGFINGFCWGLTALMLSGMGAVAQKFGIVQVLLVLTFIPVISSYFVKFLKPQE